MAQMIQQQISGIDISIEYANETDTRVSEQEIRAYIARSREKYPHEVLNSLKLEVDGEDVGISYGLAPVPFDRIRRITGYLVGTMDRWNNAKSVEEHDRVKHGINKSDATLPCASVCGK